MNFNMSQWGAEEGQSLVAQLLDWSRVVSPFFLAGRARRKNWPREVTVSLHYDRHL